MDDTGYSSSPSRLVTAPPSSTPVPASLSLLVSTSVSASPSIPFAPHNASTLTPGYPHLFPPAHSALNRPPGLGAGYPTAWPFVVIPPLYSSHVRPVFSPYTYNSTYWSPYPYPLLTPSTLDTQRIPSQHVPYPHVNNIMQPQPAGGQTDHPVVERHPAGHIGSATSTATPTPASIATVPTRPPATSLAVTQKTFTYSWDSRRQSPLVTVSSPEPLPHLPDPPHPPSSSPPAQLANPRTADALETELDFLKDEWATIGIMLDSLRNAFRAERPETSMPWPARARLGPSSWVSVTTGQRHRRSMTDNSLPILSNPDMQREMRTAYDDLVLQVQQLEKKIDKLHAELRQVAALTRQRQNTLPICSSREEPSGPRKRGRDTEENTRQSDATDKRRKRSTSE